MKKLSWRRFLNRKGVSPVIGMVLITAVMFSVLALFFVWRASQEDIQIQSERARIQQLKLVEGESIEFLTIPGGNLQNKNIYFYNTGTSPPVIQHVYVDGTDVDISGITWDSTDSRKGYFKITESVTLSESLKAETQLGNLYSYFTPAAVIDILSYSDFGNSVRILLDGSKSTAMGSTITRWVWDIDGEAKSGARVVADIEKGDTEQSITITLDVYDNTDADSAHPGHADFFMTIPALGDTGGGEGNPGFGGEGAPGGIYISLGGTGGGTSVAEGRIIAFNIKNFSGRMIPLTALRFYGVKSPSNYTVNNVVMGPVGGTMTTYYDGASIADGGIAQFTQAYYMGDKDEVHIEVKATTGGQPGEGDVFMVILYDAATPQNYYTVTVPIRKEDSTDYIVFDPNQVFQVTGGGDTLQGKSLDLNNKILKSIGVAFSSPDDETDPCEDRMIEFNVAGVAMWTGSVASESTIYLGTDSNGDGVPDTGVFWDNSRSIKFKFNFTDVAQRFYYFVYRFSDGSSAAHKIPRFTLSRASGQPERRDVSGTTGGTVTWTVDITQVDQLTTPMDLTVAGLPCFCTATFSPGSPISMPNTTTVTIQVLPGAPKGLYPLVITGNNHLNANSTVLFLYIS